MNLNMNIFIGTICDKLQFLTSQGSAATLWCYDGKSTAFTGN